MKGNKKIGITAEFVSIIKAKENPEYNYFVSSRARFIYSFFNLFFKKTIEKTLISRLELSKGFDQLIFSLPSKNIVDLGAGYSLRGFNSKQKVYFDLDFPEIISNKKNILLRICKDKNKKFPKHYHLIRADLLKNYFVKRTGRSIFFAEGVLSYFNQVAFDTFIARLHKVMHKGDTFIYNERWMHNPNRSYRFIRKFLSLISKSSSYLHFSNQEEAKEYFEKQGFSKCYFLKKGEWDFIKIIK